MIRDGRIRKNERVEKRPRAAEVLLKMPAMDD
jgi:hypothetical protein